MPFALRVCGIFCRFCVVYTVFPLVSPVFTVWHAQCFVYASYGPYTKDGTGLSSRFLSNENKLPNQKKQDKMASLLGFIIYFIPTIIVCCNRHRNTAGIILINVLLGWTGIGWLVALIWSVVSPTVQTVAPVIIYNNSGSGVQHTNAVQPWEPIQVQGPSPVQQLAGRAAEAIHEAMVPPPIKEAKVLTGINFQTQADWELLSPAAKSQWGSFERYYNFKN